MKEIKRETDGRMKICLWFGRRERETCPSQLIYQTFFDSCRAHLSSGNRQIFFLYSRWKTFSEEWEKVSLSVLFDAVSFISSIHAEKAVGKEVAKLRWFSHYEQSTDFPTVSSSPSSVSSFSSLLFPCLSPAYSTPLSSLLIVAIPIINEFFLLRLSLAFSLLASGVSSI